MTLESALTAAVYSSTLGEPAVYTDSLAVDSDVTVIPQQEPDTLLDVADVGINGVQYLFRVRVSELANPQRGEILTHESRAFTIDRVERLNISEWLIYGVA